jgi:hypothetical protein
MRILCFGGFNGCTQGGADAAKWLKSTKIEIKNLLELLYGCIQLYTAVYSNSLVAQNYKISCTFVAQLVSEFQHLQKKLFCFVLILISSCKTIPTEQFMSNHRNLSDEKGEKYC